MAASSQARRLSACRQFFGFLYGEAIRGDDPTSAVDVSPPRAAAAENPVHRRRREADRGGGTGRRAVRRGPPPSGIIEILYAAGLRVTELVALPLTAAKASDGVVLVRGKGGKERLVPLNGHARAAIASYLEVRDDFLPKGVKAAASSFPRAAPAATSRGGAAIRC